MSFSLLEPRRSSMTVASPDVELPSGVPNELHLHHSSPTLLVGEPSSHLTTPSVSFDPLAYVEVGSTSGVSGTTCPSTPLPSTHPAVATFKAAFGNVVHLIPIPNAANRPLLHMEVVIRDAGQEFRVQTLEAQDEETLCSMGNILRRYRGRIESVALDASALANPTEPMTMAHAVGLPLSPRAVASEGYVHSGPEVSPPRMLFPFLTELKSLSITTGRAVSVCDLLEFLHFTPMLRSLMIYNARRHSAIYPESFEHISEPNLPYLESVSIDGLLTRPAESLLAKLLPSLKESTRTEVHFHEIGYPVFEHQGVMQRLFASVRHACISYSALDADIASQPETKVDPSAISMSTAQGESEYTTQYLFSFADVNARVQVHWHWTGVPSISHIGLVSPALAGVHTLSLSLRNISPTCADLNTVLLSFRNLKRVELLDTHPVPRSHPFQDQKTDTETDTDTLMLTKYKSEHKVFTVRAAPAVLLRPLVSVPHLFAFELPRRATAAQGAYQPPPGPAAGPAPADVQTQVPCLTQRLARAWYRPLWALMVHKERQPNSLRRGV